MGAHRPGSRGVTLYGANDSGFAKWIRNVDQIDLHHSYPKFMGGDPAQTLTRMSRLEHGRLHSSLYDFLGPRGMAPRAGYTGADIQGLFSESVRLETMAEFYRGPGAQFTSAARDFFTLHY